MSKNTHTTQLSVYKIVVDSVLIDKYKKLADKYNKNKV